MTSTSPARARRFEPASGHSRRARSTWSPPTAPSRRCDGSSTLPDLAVAVIYPELLGLYADRGNALGFRYRARLRGLDTEIVNVPVGAAIPSTADLYILGGAEDT